VALKVVGVGVSRITIVVLVTSVYLKEERPKITKKIKIMLLQAKQPYPPAK
jgi:hypothetical protein